jgi:hypothetical protein
MSSSEVLATDQLRTHDDHRFLLISRRILYLQAVLITIVAVIAFGAGYLIGKSSSQSDAAAAPNLSLDRDQATDY